ncbi:Ig-like domain-containing protein [Staphylococcus felis]|uniref:Ig-like domain-containing protein n=1 Tax=Staphylococcus felis TaxID=46127 RepID=UPI0039679507
MSELTFKNVIDTIRPVRPVVTNTEAGSHIIWGYGETYKDEIHVRLPNNRLVSTKVGRNGTWMIGVPWDITLNVGNRVYAFEVDKAGNYSLPGIGRIVDTKAPEAPKVDEVTSESENIKGTAEPNSIVTVIFPDGTTNEVTVNEAGEFTVNIPINLAGGEKIQIKATDQSTNESPVTEVTVKAIVISEEPVEDPGENETAEELAENSGKDETTEEPIEGSGENETVEEPVEDSGVDKTEEELAENSGKDETTEEPVEGSGENETAEESVENSEVDEIAEEPIENSEEAETPEDDQKAEVAHNPELTQSIIDKQEANPKPLTEEMTRVDPSNIEAKTMISLQQSELFSQSIPKEPSGKTNIIIQAKVVGKDKDNHNSRDTILPNTGTSTDNARTGWIMSLFGFGVLAHFYRRKQKDTTQS